MRQWVSLIFVGLMLTLISAPGHAADSPGTPDDNPLAPLQFFQGNWHCAGTFVHSGKAIESDEGFALILDGKWLRMQHRDIAPNTFKALQLWGFDASNKRFAATIFDNFGGARRYVSQGWDNDRWVWTNANAGNHTDRFVFERHGADSYQMSYQVRRGQTPWQTGDTLTCHRQ